MRHIIAVRQVN